MKLIAKDNYDREMISDTLIAENVSDFWATEIKAALNNRLGEHASIFVDAVPDDYKLYRFEP